MVVLRPAGIFPHPEDETRDLDGDDSDDDGTAEEDEDEQDSLASYKIPPVELLEQLRPSFRGDKTQLMLIALTAIIAAGGLLRDSAAIVIGAMIIAPLLLTNLGLGLAVCIGDRRMLKLSTLSDGLNLVAAFVVAVAIGLVLEVDPTIEQVASRTMIQPSDVIIAAAAGTAATLALTAGLQSSLVGIMVAVALLPSVVATGLLVGSGQWTGALGAGLLTAINVIFLNLSAAVTFWCRGYRRDRWIPAADGRLSSASMIVAWAVLLVLGAALATVSFFRVGL